MHAPVLMTLFLCLLNFLMFLLGRLVVEADTETETNKNMILYLSQKNTTKWKWEQTYWCRSAT